MADRDIIIVGGGVAGLTAGLIARQYGFDAAIVDPMPGGGGQLMNIHEVINYPGLENAEGFNLGAAVAGQAMNSGVAMQPGTVASIETGSGLAVVLDGGARLTADAIILAVGSEIKRTGITGEQEFEGRGISYCALCDGSFFSNQDVVVAGGGDSAADEALYLATICTNVTVVFPDQEMHAMATTRQRLAETANVAIKPGTRVVGVAGGEGVTEVALRSEADGSDSTIAASGVFMYTGLQPKTAFLDGVIELDAGGHIITDDQLMTSTPGIFAAGDIRASSSRLLIAAAGDGASAAKFAGQYVRSQKRVEARS